MTLLIIAVTAAITAVVLVWALKQKNDATNDAIDVRTAELEAMAAALAAATARAEAAEAKLAAVPVEAIRRYFDQSDAFDAVKAGEYDMYEGMLDCQEITEWLEAQAVQP